MVESSGHRDIADLLAEVATGAASGPDRARVLSHLVDCEACRRELAELTKVADEVLLVAPERQPQAGFENGVLARIAESAEAVRPVVSIRRRVWRSVAAVAAAVAVGLAATGAVWQATSDDRELAARYRETLDIANGKYFTAAPVLDAGGTQVGHVFLYQGEPSWVFTVLDRAPKPGSYDVAITTAGGTDTVATCSAETTSCGVGATVDTDIDRIHQVRLVEPGGTVLTATLKSWPAPR